MTDIVDRLRREAVRFNEMDAAGDQPWVADAAWAADNFSAAADEIERLRAEIVLLEATGAEAADEIERLRAERDALKAERYAVGENYEIAKRGQLSAEAERDAARREGIEQIVEMFSRRYPYDDIAAEARALLTEDGR